MKSTVQSFGKKLPNKNELKYSYLGFLNTKKIIFNYNPNIITIIDRLEDETTLELWLETYQSVYKSFLNS